MQRPKRVQDLLNFREKLGSEKWGDIILAEGGSLENEEALLKITDEQYAKMLPAFDLAIRAKESVERNKKPQGRLKLG